MRHILLSLLLLALPLSLCAQSKDYKQAIAKYQNAQTVTATATRRRHKSAVAQDETAQGQFTIKQSQRKVNISVNGGKDQLDMQGDAFTMTVGGKAHKTSSKTNPQFATFQAVLENIMTGGQTADISQRTDVSLEKAGTDIILTITPEATTKKAKRRMMFTSFVITLDSKTSEIKSLRMNEKGQNYTQYDFTNYRFQ
jgi:hypothetical protein